MLNEVYSELSAGFEGTLSRLTKDLAKIRTGRANASILDGLTVDYYGTPTPLNQVGTVKVADARLITIQPWEKNMIGAIEKSIMMSDLGLNPANDGTLIRLPIPQLTGERRRELVKMVGRVAEDQKVNARAHRRDANETIKMFEKEKEISEDNMHGALKKVQDLTDAVIKQIEAAAATKEADILEGQ